MLEFIIEYPIILYPISLFLATIVVMIGMFIHH